MVVMYMVVGVIWQCMLSGYRHGGVLVYTHDTKYEYGRTDVLPSSLLPTSLSSHYRGGRLRCDDDRSAGVIRSFYCHGGGDDDVLVVPLCIARNVTHSVARGLDRIGIVRDVDRPRPSHYVRLVRGMLAKGAQLRSLEPLEEGGGA